jgi:glycosyltransferase involved in cell wall biosynthesis
LTVVRNGARYLPQTIVSIQAQTIPDWEYVIVDDASEDSTVDVVERAARQDARVRLLKRSEQGGPYVAANEGLAVALGRYVARIDSDDIARRSRLEVQLGFLSEHEHLRACAGFQQRMTSEGVFLPERHFSAQPGVILWRLCFGADPPHSSAFVERAAFEEIGGYAPLQLAQDWRMWSELSRRNWLGIVPEVVVYRRDHSDRLTIREPRLQDEFGSDVAREHIRILSGEDWSIADVRLLRSLARHEPAPLKAGLRILERWAALWERDERLSEAELNELFEWTTRLRRHHLRRWKESRPVTGSALRLGGRLSVAVRRSGSVSRRLLRRAAGRTRAS